MTDRLAWTLIQSFVAVARLGSLSKAAVVLGISQPTLSRHVSELERRLEMTLFDRSTQGLKITDMGIKLLDSSEAMQSAAEQFSRVASGASATIEGTIRISANEVIGMYYLPCLLSDFGQEFPEITVELDISNTAVSLNKRDADIALRMFRPTQADLIIRRLPDIGLSIVASEAYLARIGDINELSDIAGKQIIGFDNDSQVGDTFEQLTLPITSKDFSARTDFLPLQIELARSDAGITVTHHYLLQRFGELTAVLPNVKLPSLEFWLVCHADVQHNRRIRLMMDFLFKRLSAMELN